MPPGIEPADGGVRLRVRVQPRASRTEVAGLHGEAVKIRICAPPVDGAANKELVAFLSKRVGIPKGAIEITAGETGRQKTLFLAGATAAAVRRALLEGPA